jgi:ribosomal protein S12 methylthiotransferase
MKRIGFVSLGCEKNLVDTEVMMGMLGRRGYALTSQPVEADVIVVNTCGFIDKAKKESIDTILEMAEFKNTGNCHGW